MPDALARFAWYCSRADPRALTRAFAITSAVVVQLTTSSALACSGGPDCSGSGLLPTTGQLPANAVEFLWSPPVRTGEAEASLAGIHLYRLEAGLRVEVATRVMRQDGLVHIAPRDAPASGAELALETGVAPCSPGVEASGALIRVTANAAKPSELGTIRAAEALSTSLQLAVNSGECARYIRTVSAELTLTLAPAALPYGAALRHALLIDGVETPPFRPTSAAYTSSMNGKLESSLTDRIFALCDDASAITQRGLALGAHRVQWLSRLADGTELKSPEISVDLRCPNAGDAAVDAADASTGEAGAGDAGTSDAGTPSGSATQTHTSGVDAGGAEMITDFCGTGIQPDACSTAIEPKHDDGCALVDGHKDPLSWLITGALIGIMAVLTRGRRRGPSP